tara:strand:+ start:402 stop:2111 length:1710 start_codon:yes stop_codon:yes gene_type:complete
MQIAKVKLENFRNFQSAVVNFNGNSLVIGGNDVGKTNMFYALRLLLDRSTPESELEPEESDFHISSDGSHAESLSILIKLNEITQDAVIARLKGYVSDEGECFIAYRASRGDLSYQLLIGHSENDLTEIDSRYFLRSIHFKYIQSSRDLGGFIRKERRNLLKISKDSRKDKQKEADGKKEASIKTSLEAVNASIAELSYVGKATESLNRELKELSHHNEGYSVGLETKSADFGKFLDQLSLGATTGGLKVGLGGDGRNNQILLALWKAKSEAEHDIEDEAIIYCIEEPESHLHPHQQRKLAKYLIDKLGGQVLSSTHSPHITSGFSPDSIIRLLEQSGETRAAGEGCSPCIADAWAGMGYRMSVIPAEAFFSDGVLLVEGPSEVQFYRALAQEIGIDLDYSNICILSVDGVDFAVYVRILEAMEIPWCMRTDNDVSKVPYSDPAKYRFAGLNRALKIASEKEYEDRYDISCPSELTVEWKRTSVLSIPKGIFISKIDLETDLVEALPDTLKEFSGAKSQKGAIKYLQKRKAIRMGQFIAAHKDALPKLMDDDLAMPLHFLKALAETRNG